MVDRTVSWRGVWMPVIAGALAVFGFDRLSAAPQDAPPQSESSRPTAFASITPKAIEALRDRILPRIEKHTGRKFQRVPKVVLSHAVTVSRVLFEEVREQFEVQFPSMSDRDRRNAATQSSVVIASTLLGKFDLRSKVLYLLPKRFQALVKLGKFKAEQQRDILAVILAHEMTHALQDEAYPMAAANRSIRDQATMHGRQVVLEGHATYIQGRVAIDLGIEAASKAYDDLFVAKPSKVTSNFQQRFTRATSKAYYYRGSRFFADLVERRGVEAQWLPFKAPPANANFAFDFTTWSEKGGREPDAPRRFAELARLLTRRPRAVMASTADQTILRSLCALRPKGEVDPVLAPLERAWFAQCGTGSRLGLVIGMIFEDARSASRYVESARRWFTEELGAANGYEIDDEAKAEGYRELAYWFKRRKFGQIRGVIRWYRDGGRVVQIDSSNLRAKPEQFDATARRAFELMR